MTSKEYLNRAYKLNELIDSHIRERDQLWDMATCIKCATDFSRDKIKGGNLPTSQFAGIVERIVDLERKINNEIDSLVAIKDDIHNAINEVQDIDERLVLRYRHIEMMDWDDIAAKMNCSRSHANRVYTAALQSVIV